MRIRWRFYRVIVIDPFDEEKIIATEPQAELNWYSRSWRSAFIFSCCRSWTVPPFLPVLERKWLQDSVSFHSNTCLLNLHISYDIQRDLLICARLTTTSSLISFFCPWHFHFFATDKKFEFSIGYGEDHFNCRIWSLSFLCRFSHPCSSFFSPFLH